MSPALFSSDKEDWETPDSLFEELNEEFNFTLDPCASFENKKCDQFYSIADNGLLQDWGGETVFCNPPYGSKKTAEWIKKCAEEGSKPHTTVVLLIPARTDTKAFHDFIYEKAKIRFIKGRLKFGNAKNSAPFPSMLVIFRSRNKVCWISSPCPHQAFSNGIVYCSSIFECEFSELLTDSEYWETVRKLDEVVL